MEQTVQATGATARIPERLPGWKLAMFALGQLGWSLGSWAVGNALNFFFLPPEEIGKAPIFPTFIFQGAVLGIATVIGLINFGGRIWDAITNPIIANLSDRSKSKFGRRRIFMAIGAVPTALFAFLVFFPIADGSAAGGQTANAAWLAVTMALYYLFFVTYCTPYTSLISELGHNPTERLGISTAISITWALGFAIANQTYAIFPAVQAALHVDATRAFQYTIGGIEIVAAVLMLLPVLFIDEHKYAEFHVSSESVLGSVASTFRNRDFRWFVGSDLLYWISLNFIQAGIVYYVITLLGLDKSLPSFLLLVMFVLSFVFYVPINLITRKLGKKPVLVFAYIVFTLSFVLALGFGWMPLPAALQAWLVVVVASVPIAIFGILPNSIIADVAESHGIETGTYQAGIFFGTRTFVMNLGIALANLLFPSFLLLGRSADHPLGLRLTAAAAIGFCLVGLFLFLHYDEKRVLGVLASKEGKPSAQATASAKR